MKNKNIKSYPLYVSMATEISPSVESKVETRKSSRQVMVLALLPVVAFIVGGILTYFVLTVIQGGTITMPKLARDQNGLVGVNPFEKIKVTEGQALAELSAVCVNSLNRINTTHQKLDALAQALGQAAVAPPAPAQPTQP